MPKRPGDNAAGMWTLASGKGRTGGWAVTLKAARWSGVDIEQFLVSSARRFFLGAITVNDMCNDLSAYDSLIAARDAMRADQGY